MKKKEIQFNINDNGCHECISHRCSNNGYPYFRVNGIYTKMSRYIFEKVKGKLKEGDVVRHTCDNPKCINPEHLISGTQKENMEDKVIRGRIVTGKSSPLSKEKASDIKRSTLTNKILASNYKVSVRTIQRARNGQTWKH